MRDGRGEHMLKLKAENLEKVRRWTEDNPGGTMTECMKALNLSYNCIVRHLKTIDKEKQDEQRLQGDMDI